MNEREKQITKILVLGLDNSGKTSIILNSFKENLNLLSYLSLKPTRGLEISEMEDENKRMTIWDFGGQEKYRAKYLEDLPSNLIKATEIIFVLDIQDKYRYDKAVQYFRNIMDILKQENKNFELSLYLHKFDPTLSKTHPKITEESIENLTNKFRELVPKEFNFSIYKTSIYTFFKKVTFWTSYK